MADVSGGGRSRGRGHKNPLQVVELRVPGVRAHPTGQPLGSFAQTRGVRGGDGRIVLTCPVRYLSCDKILV